MSDFDYEGALKTVGGIIEIAAPFINMAAPGAGSILTAIGNLIPLATSAGASIADAKRAWELTQGAVAGDVEEEEVEAEIAALIARGIKPIPRPEP